jgi:serine protease Do
MRRRKPFNTLWVVAVAVLFAAVGGALAETPFAPAPTTAPSTLPFHAKAVPENVRDLRALQAQVQAVVARVSPAVVGLRIGGQGSGVIVSEDGYVLTAGHVASAPGRDVTVILSNGRFAHGQSLGVNYGMDSGLVKILDDPPAGGWPHVEMGKSGDLVKGQWCIALGHPGGYKFGRTPPLRLGRILEIRGNFVRTDCTLVGGDSGGPLFDLDGKVIAIHSRIGNALSDNLHVPIDTFAQTWDRLARGESWGMSFLGGRPGGPYLGFQVDPDASDCRVGELYSNSPAGAAGIHKGDVITKFDGQRIANAGELLIYLSARRPGDEVSVDVRRDDKPMTFKLTVGRRPPTTRPSQPAPQPMRPPVPQSQQDQ